MLEMSIVWLRVATALYSIGLLHAILTVLRRNSGLFGVATGSFCAGGVIHFVAMDGSATALGNHDHVDSRIASFPDNFKDLGVTLGDLFSDVARPGNIEINRARRPRLPSAIHWPPSG